MAKKLSEAQLYALRELEKATRGEGNYFNAEHPDITGWIRLSEYADVQTSTINALETRGLIVTMGYKMFPPWYVKITDAGRAALREEGEA